MRSLSIFLLLTSAAYKAFGKNVHEEKSVSRLCEPVDPIHPFFNADFQIPKEITPKVDDEFKASRMSGFDSKEECLAELKHINFISEIKPIKQYIDLVFTHLPGFAINFYPESQALDIGDAAAAYAQMTKTMQLHHSNKDLFSHYSHLRHEYRHAAMHAAQKILSKNPHSFSTQPFSPLTDAEKFVDLLSKGDDRIERLQELLNLEGAGQLNQKQKDSLEKIRKDALKEYQKYYKFTQTISISLEESQLSIKELQKMLEPSHGPVKIKKTQSPDIIEITYEDPLQATVNVIHLQRQLLEENFDPTSYFLERDAYLHGNVPQKIIEKFYPELEKYTQNLIAQASSTPTSYKREVSSFLSISDHVKLGHLDISDLSLLTDPQEFKDEFAPFFIPIVLWAAENGQIEAAKTGLNTLIKHGHRLGEAHLELARIHYQDKSYAQAAISFKYAQQKGVSFSKQDREQYCIAVQPGRERLKEAAMKAGISEEEFNSDQEQRGSNSLCG